MNDEVFLNNLSQIIQKKIYRIQFYKAAEKMGNAKDLKTRNEACTECGHNLILFAGDFRIGNRPIQELYGEWLEIQNEFKKNA